MDVIAQRASSHGHTGDGNARIDALTRIGDDTGLRQPCGGIQQRAAVHAQIATIAQLRQDGLRYAPEAELQGRAVLDQQRGAYRNRALNAGGRRRRSEEHTSELQSHVNLVCRLLLEKKKKNNATATYAQKTKKENS